MWTLFLFLYNLICVPLLYIVFYTGSLFNEKMKRGRKGRARYWENAKEIAARIPQDASVFLFHSSSVGEWEQAVPVIEKMKERDNSIFVIVTFFSPSGYHVVNNQIIDAKMYLPLDSFCNAKRFFTLFKPKAWIICKYDIWPNMLRAAKRNRIPVLLTSAELAEDSKRYTFPMNVVNKIYYKKIDYILAISEDTRQRFLKIFPFQDRLFTAGDSRFDRIYQKVQRILPEPPIRIFKMDDGFKLILGSCWPTDEKHVLPACVNLMKKHQKLQLIVVPHEISEAHIQSIEELFTAQGIDVERYSIFSKQEGTFAKVAIIDTVGILSKLYKITKLAYVGGSFGSGVHNVMEPAAFAQPIIFGPKHLNSFEACQLEYLMAAHTIHNQNEFEIIVEHMLNNEELRAAKGQDALKFLTDHLGSTDKTISLLEILKLIKPSDPE